MTTTFQVRLIRFEGIPGGGKTVMTSLNLAQLTAQLTEKSLIADFFQKSEGRWHLEKRIEE
ncbi:hypothetical protein [Laspinema sp. D2d]|uniref:hypothetical protein n=1 Tax=Laspinema sp. D2d TaxID=2953686 RepID=UPI0021BB1BA2|nr:hypothetical protein [Laspinema sp. D2d]